MNGWIRERNMDRGRMVEEDLRGRKRRRKREQE